MVSPFTAAAGTASLITPEIASNVQSFRETEEEKKFFQTETGKRGFLAGGKAIEEYSGSSAQDFLADLLPANLLVDERRRTIFREAYQEQLIKEGIPRNKAFSLAYAATNRQIARSTSEIPTSLLIEAQSELLGGALAVGGKILPRQVSSRALQNIGLKNPLARGSALISARAGLTEGALQVINQDVVNYRFGAREKPLFDVGFEPGGRKARIQAQLEPVLGGAVLGSLTAGAFGFVIGGGRLSPRVENRLISRGTSTLGNVIDILEKPGDIIAGQVSRRLNLPEPTIRVRGVTNIPNQSKQLTALDNFLNNPLASFSQGRTQSRTQSRAFVPNFIPNFSSRTGTNSRGTTRIIPPETPRRGSGKVPSESDSSARTTTNVPSFVPSFSNVPVSSIYGAPFLPLPPIPSIGSGARGQGTPTKRKYFNELDAVADFLRRF